MTVALAVLFARNGAAEEDVLRARGLIIEDAAGRERILIGAPIPEAVNRVRTDEARVREVWAPGFPDPDAYMGYYQDYSHETNGMLILSEDGFDRLAEGLSLVLQDDGPHGILIGTLADGIFLGTAPAGHAWTGLAEEFQGLLARRDGEIVHQLNLAAGN